MAELDEAFDQLARYAEWRRASALESQALDMLAGAPSGESLLQQLGRAQAEGARIARDLLRATWQAALTANPAKAAERLANSFDAMDRRALAGGTQHAVGERQLGKVVGVLTRQYPVWMVTADSAAAHLPLVDGLFDMAIVDDADRLSAPALLPLLARARRAVVLGSAVDASARAAKDALSLCWTREGVERHRLESQTRSHPQIVEVLSGGFHGGRLAALVDFAGLGETVPPALAGLHWHEAAEDGRSAVETAVDMVAGWLKAPLLDPDRPFTVGIAAADPGVLAALTAAVAGRGLDAALDERLLVGPPDRFFGAMVDLLVLLPGIGGGMPEPRAAHLAANRALFHDAVSAARGGLHLVGDADACRRAGGHAAALADACRRLAEAQTAARKREDAEPLLGRLVALLDRSGLAYWPEDGAYRVVGTLGQPYRMELPGETAEGTLVAPDDPELIPAIVDPFDLRRGGEKLKMRLDRLV